MILTEVSLKRPVFATVTILAMIVLGAVSYMSLNVDEWPDVEFPFVTVSVTYKGAGPEQVESKILQKVEESVSAISGVKHIYSTAREGLATTTIEFSLETLPAVAAQDVRDKIGRIRGELPQDAEEPVIMRFNPAQSPIVSVAVTGKMSVREMTSLVDDVIKRRLETVNGVGSIDVKGNQKREIQLELSRAKVAAFNLTIPEILDNIRGENMEVPGGKLTAGNREVNMRTMGNFTNAQEFLDVPVGRKDGRQLYLQHIATVRDSTEEGTSLTTLNGKPAIGLDVMKQSGANTVQVARDVAAVVEKLKKDLPPGVELTIVRDNSKYIKESVNDVLFNLVIGGILAVIIVFVFLGNWRSTMISAIAIPASIIATFFTMKLMNFSINSMSLLALSLAVGLLIDDAIVVIENIVRHMEMGKDKYTAALEGTKEIGLAVTATTLTLVAVFVPVGMMTGIVGQFFKQFGITVAFSVLVSLFIAFTLTPMLSANFLDVSHGHKGNFLGRILDPFNAWFDRMTLKYSRFLALALHHRGKVLLLAGGLFLSSLFLMQFLGSGFITRVDNGELVVESDVDPGTSLAGVAEISEKMQAVLKSVPEVHIAYNTSDLDKVKIFIDIGDKNKRKRSGDQIAAEIRRKMNEIPGVQANILLKAGLDAEKPVSIVIKGESLAVLGELADKTQRIMSDIPGTVDISSSYKPGKPDIQMSIRREMAADLGVSTANISETLRTMFTGVVVNQFKDGDDRYDVRVRLGEGDRRNITDLSHIYLASRYKDNLDRTVLVPLEQVTDRVYATGPSQINRYDRQKDITLTANLQGLSLGDFNKKAFAEIKKIELPPGYNFVATGESERMGDTFTSMVVALALAVIFIFFVLAAQFESYIDPFSIMLSLPLAIIGAIVGLLVMGSELSIMSMIGIIMLMGLVTKNAILLVDFAKQRRAEGMERDAALVEAAQIRMRPIMMTTAAMIFGMLPLVFGFGPGAEGRAPMAHAIVGGLITSTILTLVVVPVVYSLLDDAKKWIKGKSPEYSVE